jgi:hypothetical protein
MQGKVLVRKLHQKQYQPVIWVKDETHIKGKRQLEMEPCDTREIAEQIISQKEAEGGVFFTDIKEVTKEIEGEFYIPRGYYS